MTSAETTFKSAFLGAKVGHRILQKFSERSTNVKGKMLCAQGREKLSEEIPSSKDAAEDALRRRDDRARPR